jgi:hypothetical protein
MAWPLFVPNDLPAAAMKIKVHFVAEQWDILCNHGIEIEAR